MKEILKQAGYALEASNGTWLKAGYGGLAYSDGDEVEQRIANIINTTDDVTVLSKQLRQHCTDWPSTYHLSSSRANMLRPFEQQIQGSTVLEIGAGCGAITRYLGEVGAEVLALEGTQRRAAIARSRTRDLHNVYVVADSFDVFECDEKFDYVTLIGVLEYANLFMPGLHPAKAMLRKALRFLKPTGSLIVAIENQLGLKYFAGANEDHVGSPMFGIEGRYRPNQVQTFGRAQLEKLMIEAGFAKAQFFAPFPDYKLPSSIVAESGFLCDDFDASALAWQSVCKDPQMPVEGAFNMELAWQVVSNNKLGMDLSNSFLVFASLKNEPILSQDFLAWHYSSNRSLEYCKKTLFIASDSKVMVQAQPIDSKAKSKEGGLLNQFLNPNQDYTNGTLLSYQLIRVLSRSGCVSEDLSQFFKEYINILSRLVSVADHAKGMDQNAKVPGEFFDCIPNNIVFFNEDYFYIDAEWTAKFDLDYGFLLFRALLSFIGQAPHYLISSGLDHPSRREFMRHVFESHGWELSNETWDRYLKTEYTAQEEVAGYRLDFDQFRASLENIPFTLRPSLSQGKLLRDQKISDLSQVVVVRDEQISDLSQIVAVRDEQISNLSQTVAVRDEQITRLNQAVSHAASERDAALGIIAAMRASTSWRFTAPLRFVGYLVRGNFIHVARMVRHGLGRLASFLPQSMTAPFRRASNRLLKITGMLPDSPANFAAIAALVSDRCEMTRAPIALDPMSPPMPSSWPAVDISVVTFNSERWVERFIDSLLALDYPRDRLSIRFVDNSSTDGTEQALRSSAKVLTTAGFAVDVLTRPNNGFGAGHNVAIGAGEAPFFLVSNIDLVFEPDSLRQVVSMAMADSSRGAAWELRQKPYEHPKFYDPVTGATNWNSHACVLIRRTAFNEVGGYDDTLFMYGEDVELSYRLRRSGYVLRYCPRAVVWHFSYESSDQIKPLQYTGSTFANLYLRIKYGKLTDILAVPMLAMRLVFAPEAFPGSRKKVLRNLLKLIAVTPKALRSRRSTTAHFPFRTWDYELIRDGAFIALSELPIERPMVSIVTRTHRGRELYLRQALMSGAHQTWPNFEHIVVEDGGESMRYLCEEVAQATGRPIRFIGLPKNGRSKAGNEGLMAARGRWCVFLDDDDLLFADHLEVLVRALIDDPVAVASYSLAWEVPTDSSALSEGRYVEMLHRLAPELRQAFDFDVLMHHNYLPIQSVLFERRLFEQLGGFHEDMDALEDWTLWLRYARGQHFAYVPKVTSLFRTPTDQVKSKERQDAFDRAYPLALTRAQASNAAVPLADQDSSDQSNKSSGG